jgi:hypothetical protein
MEQLSSYGRSRESPSLSYHRLGFGSVLVKEKNNREKVSSICDGRVRKA